MPGNEIEALAALAGGGILAAMAVGGLIILFVKIILW